MSHPDIMTGACPLFTRAVDLPGRVAPRMVTFAIYSLNPAPLAQIDRLAQWLSRAA